LSPLRNKGPLSLYEDVTTTDMPAVPAGGANLPGYIQACRDGRWHLDLKNKQTGKTLAVPYVCNSWRHTGACRRRRAEQDAARVQAGLERLEGPFAYAVLTVWPKEWPGGTQDAYLALFPMFKKLIKRVRRRWGDTEYCVVIEQHRSTWPHLNAIFTGELAEDTVEDWREARKEFAAMARECGFGIRVWLEPVRKTKALAQYVAKLAGEVSKPTQVPWKAPKNFRRLRASRGFLPPVVKGDEWTGKLVTTPVKCHDECKPDNDEGNGRHDEEQEGDTETHETPRETTRREERQTAGIGVSHLPALVLLAPAAGRPQGLPTAAEPNSQQMEGQHSHGDTGQRPTLGGGGQDDAVLLATCWVAFAGREKEGLLPGGRLAEGNEGQGTRTGHALGVTTPD